MTGAFPRSRGESGAALVTYLTAGYPDRARSAAAIRVAAEHSDIIELGVPFSDPVADGPVIQEASQQAIGDGMSLAGTLELLDEVRPRAPVVLFSYLNPVLSHGMERTLSEAAELGVAGLLLTDLPADGDPEIEGAVQNSALDLVRLVAPTSDRERVREIVRGAEGFIYLIARLGVTGVSAEVASDLADNVMMLRSETDLPVAAGFGISTAAQAREVATAADGVIVGSRAVQVLGNEGVDALGRLLKELRAGARAG